MTTTPSLSNHSELQRSIWLFENRYPPSPSIKSATKPLIKPSTVSVVNENLDTKTKKHDTSIDAAKDVTATTDPEAMTTPKPKSWQVPFLLALIFGLLLGFIILLVVLMLWFTTPKPTTTQSTVFISTLTTVTTTTSETTITETTTTSTATTTTTTMVIPTVNALWKFDGNTKDQHNIYNGIPCNGSVFGSGYTGLSNTSASFSASQDRFVIVNSSFVNLTGRSFTIEMWFYPVYLSSNDSGLFGQCETISQDRCIYYAIRNYLTYLAFYNDDTTGLTAININQWYHVAFVYDYPTTTQAIYLNGELEYRRTSFSYQGEKGDIFIGAVNSGQRYGFTGYIDEVSLMTRAKTADEVLMDATLVCFYTFDTGLYNDTGPLALSATGTNVTWANDTGRVNSALSLATTPAYFVVGGLTRLGTSGQAFSISIWINPMTVSGGTIVYVSGCNNGCNGNWCLPFIELTPGGYIVVQTLSGVYDSYVFLLVGPQISVNIWTHVAQTYSSINGMRLYINGNLYNQTSGFIYAASTIPNYVYLGYFPWPICAFANGVLPQQYYGLLDEFRLYARELTATEVYNLAYSP